MVPNHTKKYDLSCASNKLKNNYRNFMLYTQTGNYDIKFILSPYHKMNLSK